MVATTDQKARLLDLATGVLEMVRDGNRDIARVSEVLQIIKDDPGFAKRLLDESDILKLVGVVRVEGAERFVCDDEALKKANVGWTGSNFDRLFRGKVEAGVQPAELNIHELKKPSVDEPIRKELGRYKEEIDLAHFLQSLRNLKDCWYIAYIKDKEGKLWDVSAGRSSVGRDWGVGVRSVEDPDMWDVGNRVLSRK